MYSCSLPFYHLSGGGDFGSKLRFHDAQAKAAYRRKLEEVREELEEAKEFRNLERIAKAEDEIEALSKELSRAIGRGGRHRRAGSTSERTTERDQRHQGGD